MLHTAEVLQRIADSHDSRMPLFYGEAIGDLELRNRTFDRPVNFAGAIFTGRVEFWAVTFGDFACFDASVFEGPAAFRGCRFEQGASFSLATFKSVDFFQARFVGRAIFWRTFFLEEADFSQVRFCRAVCPPNEDVGEANFSWARFHTNAVFTDSKFETPVYLHRTIFRGDTLFDICQFQDAVGLNGKQNDVILPRFGRVAPEAVGELEAAGLVRPDTERHRTYRGKRLSEFVCFNNVLSTEDLERKLSNLAMSPAQKAAIATEWRDGAREMFSAGRLLSFRGARFVALDRLTCAYLDLHHVVIDRQVNGSVEERTQFADRLTANSFDAFVSHASEDKVEVARPLSARLREMGFAIWLDESAIEIGDVLTPALENAMQTCRNGIVILSPDYIRKRWTQHELQRLLALCEGSEKKLFFIWHKLNEDEVRGWSPLIAERVAYLTGQFTVEQLAEKLAMAIYRGMA